MEKFKSPLQPSAVESPHCTISNWPQWYGGALGNDSTRFNWITVVEAFTHGIGAVQEMWSIVKRLLYHKKLQISYLISCLRAALPIYIHGSIFVGNNNELFGKLWSKFCTLTSINARSWRQGTTNMPELGPLRRKNSAVFWPKKGTKKPRNS